MKRTFFFLLVLFCCNTLFAQSFTLSGYIRDKDSGEELINATIADIKGNRGALTNLYGFYSLTLPAGEYSIRVSYSGYYPLMKTINLTEDMTWNIDLVVPNTDLEVVEITSEVDNENVSSTQMSATKLTIEEISTIPVLFGEKDILKTIQLLPGVSSAGEGNTGFHVRGGAIDQNLILLDEAPVYNASHLLGFFSVFNSDALKDMTLYKGGIPSMYGGRASSVLDVYMRNGNMKKYKFNGGIGLISSRLTVEGPIVKDKASFIVSGRRTYADLLLRLTFPEQFGDVKLYFWDLNAKVNYKIGQKDRLFLSGYFGRDVFGFQGIGFDWGNQTATVRWNHLFSEKLFANTSFIFSKYNYRFRADLSGFNFSVTAGITDFNLKSDFNYFYNPNNTFRFGVNSIYHSFSPGELDADSSFLDGTILERKHAVESAAYFSNEQKFSDRFSARYGVRISTFNYIGPGTVYEYSESNAITDSTVYGTLDHIKTHWGIEPRVSGTFLINDQMSVKLSYNRMYQYLHLLSNSTTTTPTDLWVPSTQIIKPIIADQVALGYFQNLFDNKLEMSVEGYYKHMQNLIDYENGAQILFNPSIESQIINGRGWSYGAEFYIRKRTGKITGWISYTLSKTRHKFELVDGGNPFPARHDRTHDLSVVAMYKVHPRVAISGTFVYQTGNAATFPSGKYVIDGRPVNYFTERNGYRMPDYHRLDIGATIYGKPTRKFITEWNIFVYNVYHRLNAYTINFQESSTNPGTTEAVKLALFGIVPSVTFNFKF